MRKITQGAYNAWKNKTPFKKANTRVDVDFDRECTLYLHGNCIAKEVDGELFVNHCGWTTNTTRERLNMFPNVHIRKFQGDFLLNEQIMNPGWNKIG